MRRSAIDQRGAAGAGEDMEVVRRPEGLITRLASGPWPRIPGRGEPCSSLAVADLDLDTDTVTLCPMTTPPQEPPQGVHALVWFHGSPIGEVTVAGDVAAIEPRLPSIARVELNRQIVEHRLRDLLATPARRRPMRDEQLDAVSHPPEGPADPAQVTVAVCTRDRPDDLRRCLTAITALEPPAGDVLVVDNAPSDDRTRAVVSEFPRISYIREPRRGLDWARNRALLEASTSIVAFTDDDALVHPRWIRGILHAFTEEPDAVAVTGLVAPAELATRAQILFESQGGFGRGYRRRWFSSAVGAGEIAARRWASMGAAGTGANMALKREPALQLGGFDPALDVGTPTMGGGDHEMLFRLLAAGAQLVYEPAAVVRHRHRPTLGELARQRRGDGTGSYSIFLGAGPRYGPDQRRAFLRHALGPAVVRQVFWFLASAVRPRSRPWLLARSLSRGALDAVFGGPYRRARAQAADELARHPGEPTAPPLTHPRPSTGATDSEDISIVVDLADDLLAAVAVIHAGGPPGRRQVVQVTRDRRPVGTVVVDAGGSRLSTARLRWELVEALGENVVAQGTDGSPRR